jgi:predicted alpha/beta-fold hydrolase
LNTILKNLAHKVFLPRGRNYLSNPDLEESWNKTLIQNGDKKITLLFKTSTQQEAKACIILSHPYLSDAKLFFLKNGHADLYLNNGFNVFIFDYNGFGESEFVNFNYPKDLDLVCEFVKAEYPNLAICCHGISFGASQLINYSMNQGQLCNKIIIENCLDTNTSYYKKRNRKLYLTMKILMRLFPRVNQDHAYTQNIKRIHGKPEVLFIYNENDKLTTIEMGKSIQANCPVKSHFEVFKGGHLEAIKENKKYESILISFLAG